MAVQDLQASVVLEKRSDRGGTPELHVAGASDRRIRATEHLPPNEIAEHPLRRHLYHHEPGNARSFVKCRNRIVQVLDHMAQNCNTECAVSKR